MDHLSVKSTIEDQRTYVTNTVSSFNEALQQVTDKLQLQRQEVDHFFTAELQQDVPTGTALFAAYLC